MRRYSCSIIILILFIPSLLIAQKKAGLCYSGGDSALRKAISRNLLQFHDEELIQVKESVVLMAIINIIPPGKIEKIEFFSDQNTPLTEAISDAIFRTQKGWLKSMRKYTVVIPFYILQNAFHTDQIELLTTNLVPLNRKVFPLRGIIIEPIFINLGPRVSISKH